ncbi:helix-turn-helix transcriptional regulator [Aminipila terrae]|uniref:Helix-turn-helix domain-containing protein n=1 Tax=Aminipila terrae TaxID=2697030 RepID=A0A6P1MGG4_9FIRM|nr:AraC family transcriptional regulator [Aminipila terrae]QHI71674.1 helix-turn-helix domain-containing protein [Aminipila terrae]
MKNLEAVTAAIQYIENNLAIEKMNLDMISTALHYSKYHLHRIFTNTVGLSIHDYVQRRQLTEAARLLVFTNRPILDIAVISGYDSQQAFSNAFKDMYKMSPLQFRKNNTFYPLQLEYSFNIQGEACILQGKNNNREIRIVNETDISIWLNLVHLAIDGFPNLRDEEHLTALKKYIASKRAFLITESDIAIGGMMFNSNTGSIDFLAVHPLYEKQAVFQTFLTVVAGNLEKNKEISITTFREGDKADTGYRRILKTLGFKEAELLTEFGYPTQRMVLIKGGLHDR